MIDNFFINHSAGYQHELNRIFLFWTNFFRIAFPYMSKFFKSEITIDQTFDDAELSENCYTCTTTRRISCLFNTWNTKRFLKDFPPTRSWSCVAQLIGPSQKKHKTNPSIWLQHWMIAILYVGSCNLENSVIYTLMNWTAASPYTRSRPPRSIHGKPESVSCTVVVL